MAKSVSMTGYPEPSPRCGEHFEVVSIGRTDNELPCVFMKHSRIGFMNAIRADRFTFMPGQLTPVTDRQELERVYAKTGVRPLPPEEQAWISEEGCRRWAEGDFVSADELMAEYRRLKAQGRL